MNKGEIRHWGRLGRTLCIGTLLLVLGAVALYSLPSLTNLADILAAAQPSLILATLALHMLANALRTWKMHIVLRSKRSFLQTFHIYNVGLFINCLLPFRSGEFGMVLLLSSRAGFTGGEALSRLFVDRLLDLIVVLAFTLAAFWILAPLSATGGLTATMLYACAALGAVVGMMFLVIAMEDQTVALIHKIVGGLLRKDPAPWDAHLKAFVEGFRALFRAGTFFPAFGISLLAWGAIVLSYQTGMQAIFPPPQIGGAVMAACMSVLGMVVVPIPSGAGATHGAIVIALAMFGVGVEQAFAFALFYHALTTGANICMGLLSTRCLGLKPSALLGLVRPKQDRRSGFTNN